MLIRDATDADWVRIFPIFSTVVSEGRTYAYPEEISAVDARALWMLTPPGRTVAVDDEIVLGTATMGPNRLGRGSHIATGSFMVNPATRRSRGRTCAR